MLYEVITRQLPGLASQHLMAKGYGYGGEGDWKVSAMTRIVKAMTRITSYNVCYTKLLRCTNELRSISILAKSYALGTLT